MERIYLDNAATSWPKHPAVAEAMTRALELGANYGRGQSRAADDVRRVVDRCRGRLAKLFGVQTSANVCFTAGGTDSLNLAMQGLLRAGDRVVTTAMEHNSVLRPLYDLQKRIGIELTIVSADNVGFVDADAFAEACSQATRLAVVTHASNVTGSIQPVRQLASVAHQAGAVVLLDACQTAGHVPFDVGDLGVDIVATSAHKGLGGPLGLGVLAFADDCQEFPHPLRLGGTGSNSEHTAPPETLPQRYEAGSMNVPGIFGLDAALEELSIGRRTYSWVDALIDVPNITLHGPGAGGDRIGVASITVEGWTPSDFANVLESEFGIEVRAGLHCSPLAHQAIGTADSGGTIRFSPADHQPEQHDWIAHVADIATS